MKSDTVMKSDRMAHATMRELVASQDTPAGWYMKSDTVMKV